MRVFNIETYMNEDFQPSNVIGHNEVLHIQSILLEITHTFP